MSKRSPPFSDAATSAARCAGSSTEVSTGSAPFASASSGKYTRVVTLFSSPRANTETRICGAWSPPSGEGTGPGLTVMNS